MDRDISGADSRHQTSRKRQIGRSQLVVGGKRHTLGHPNSW